MGILIVDCLYCRDERLGTYLFNETRGRSFELAPNDEHTGMLKLTGEEGTGYWLINYCPMCGEELSYKK